jgi:putative PIN family toxin of toxin-antitoxin system
MSAKTNHRIIIDTNLWISFLLTNNYTKLDLILSKGRKLLFSQQLIEEFVKVVQRPKLKKYFTI